MTKKRIIAPNIIRGGAAIPLGDNIYLLKGKKHSQGGIDIGKDLEAEGDEVVKMNPKSIKVVTAQKIMGGKSPAELVVNASSTGEQEKVFDNVFKYQEKFKDRNGLNDDGTKKAQFGKEKKYVELTPSEAIAHNKITPNNAFMYGVGTEDNPEFLYPEELEPAIITASLTKSNKKKAEKAAASFRNRNLNGYIGNPNLLNLGDNELQNIAGVGIGIPLVITNPVTTSLLNNISSKEAINLYGDILAKTNHYLRPSTYLDKLYTRQLALPLSGKSKLLFDTITDSTIDLVQGLKQYKQTKDKKDLGKTIADIMLNVAIDPFINYASDIWQNAKYYESDKYKKVLERYLDKVYSNPNRKKITINNVEKRKNINFKFDGDKLNNTKLANYNTALKEIKLNDDLLLDKYGYNEKVLNGITRHEIHHAGVDQLPIFKKQVSVFDFFNKDDIHPHGYYSRNSTIDELKFFDKNKKVNAWMADPEEFYAEENYLLELMGENNYKDLNKVQKRAYIEFLKDRFNLNKNEVMRAMVYGKKQGFKLGGMKQFKDRKKAEGGGAWASLIDKYGMPAVASTTQLINAGIKFPVDLGSVIGANVYTKKQLDKIKEATLDYNTETYDAQTKYNKDKYDKLNELLDKYYKEDLADLEKHKIVRKDAVYNPIKLKTRININPQLQQIQRERDRNIRSIVENTASSKDALNRIRLENLEARDKNVAIQGQKENLETQLINQDLLQRKATMEKQVDANLRLDELRARDLIAYYNNLANLKKGYNQNKLQSTLKNLEDVFNTENLKRTSDFNAESSYRQGRMENRMNLIQGISDSVGQFLSEVNNSAMTAAKLQTMQDAYGNNRVNPQTSFSPVGIQSGNSQYFGNSGQNSVMTKEQFDTLYNQILSRGYNLELGRMGGKFKVKRRNK